MIWYEHLYMGDKAKKHRFSIIQSIREKKAGSDVYVITPPSNGNNILDIYPVTTLYQEYYEKKNLLILGIASGYQEALTLAGRIVDRMYRETGAFSIRDFLEKEETGGRVR